MAVGEKTHLFFVETNLPHYLHAKLQEIKDQPLSFPQMR